jgi:hypothetical protein
LKISKDQRAIARERIAAVRQWIAARKAAKSSSNLTTKVGVLACSRATGLRTTVVVEPARSLGARC